ncbi:MAG TPA: efflux RND transporter periplasmic adaptor subunit [Alphaproteobacteria bacterium]|nr:efflux RND transporter periplasmic adaptor subunit [Alphaproteobacteria bacterium]
MKKTIILLLVLCATALGGYAYMRGEKARAGLAATETVMTVQQGTLEEIVTAQGTLEPKDYVDVGVQVSGQLEKIHVELGDTVAQGQLIAEIDPQLYEAKVQADLARLKTLNAQIAQQKAEIKLARQQHERNEKLVTKGAISQDTFEGTATALTVAEAQLDALNAQLEEAQSTLEGDQANLGYAKIYAPISGTVVVKDVREGQTLNASQSAPTVVQLANLDVMTVRAQVAEADVMRLKPDMPVYFTTLGSQSRKWHGKVRQILPSPEVINDVVLYHVLVDVDNTDRQLMTGMSTQMFFVLSRAEDKPLIPVAALGKRLPDEDSDLGQAYSVDVIGAGSTIIPKTIHVGLMDRTQAEVTSGLAVGDKVSVNKALLPASDAQSGRGMRGMPRL